MTERIHADICIIGAGSGGLSVAAAAAQMGARTVLIEGGEMGGDCLNRGCVPSKALIAMAARGAGYDKAMAHVAATIAAIAPHDSQQRFEGLGVRVIRAWGRFTSPRDVEAGECLINARRFVIATGTAPVVPDIPGLAAVPFLTTDTIWSLRERPDHLLILGAGPVGLELAQAHRRLGAKVTVIEAASALGREDADLAAQVLAALRAEGIEIREGIHVTGVAGTAGAIKVELADGQAIHGTDLLVATGRKARTERLNLAAAGIETGAHGILTDTALRTTSRRIFAIGDVAGRGQYTHLAGYHAGIVIRRALLAMPARLREDHIPRAVFTDPELAAVGLSEAEARRRHGANLSVVMAPFSANDRALALGRTQGFIKVMVVRGRPVGAAIVGHEAAELIAPWALAIAANLRLSAMASAIFPYPTLSEVSKRAASAYFTPRLFDNAGLKRVVRLIQRLFP